jgi:murein DD-endopeptidase MepM/ murein hydrolase activator NlpD
MALFVSKLCFVKALKFRRSGDTANYFTKLKALLMAIGISWSFTAAACEVVLPIDLTQGQLVRARLPAGVSAKFHGRTLKQSESAEVVFGLPYNAPKQMKIELSGACKATLVLDVSQRRFKIERVNGLPQQTVTPDQATAKRIAAEGKLIAEARAIDSDYTFWRDAFQWPATGRQTGVYGSQRVLNGIPSSPHLGLDIAAPKGTEVLAGLAGQVSLVHEDMVMTGKTVLIDHGFGISTIYIHLSGIDVKVGQLVKAGQRIGAIGTTGRSTGPHLHFQVHWYQDKLDPSLVLPIH